MIWGQVIQCDPCSRRDSCAPPTMNSKLTRAVLITVCFLSLLWIVMPAFGNRWTGQSSLLRFDPKVSTDYNCIFVEGRTFPSFSVPWLKRSTPIDYLRIRYTSHADHQPYGILFVDPKTLAYEAHSGFADRPTHLSGRLDSPRLVRDWMRSQAQSAQAPSHDGDALEIYSALVALSATDLEHFTLPASVTLSHFEVGHSMLVDHRTPSWIQVVAALMALIPLWNGVFQRRTAPGQSATPNSSPRGRSDDPRGFEGDSRGRPDLSGSGR